jgi:hypothetical protein
MAIPYDITLSFKLPCGLSLEYDNIKLVSLDHFCCFDVVVLCEDEGPEKTNRGGVNGSQSKFLAATWPISQNQPDVPHF